MSSETAPTGARKVGSRSSHHGSYVLGYTHDTMAVTEGREGASRSQSHKRGPSWNCRLQPACMNAELLVTAGQHTAVNTFSGLVHTARQVMEVGNT